MQPPTDLFNPKIQKAISADPDLRYESPQALYSALKEVIETTGRTHLRQTIAVVGNHSGCGATHIAIALVTTLNYLGISAVYQEKNWIKRSAQDGCPVETCVGKKRLFLLSQFYRISKIWQWHRNPRACRTNHGKWLRMWFFFLLPCNGGSYYLCVWRSIVASGRCQSPKTFFYKILVTACMLLRICATTILPFILPEHFHSRSILIRLTRTSFVQTKKSGFCSLAATTWERTESPIFTFHKPFIPAPATIGVCGTTVNSGVTHFSISLCNFLHSRFLARTAYLEVNSSHEIASLSSKKDPTIPFRCNGVSYYPEITLRQLREQLHLQHKYKILDFGVLTPYSFPEFVRCDYCIVLTNVSIWKDRQLLQFIEELKKTNLGKDYKTNVRFMSMGNLKKDRKRVETSYGIRVIPVPFLENPVSSVLSWFWILWTNMERKQLSH